MNAYVFLHQPTNDCRWKFLAFAFAANNCNMHIFHLKHLNKILGELEGTVCNEHRLLLQVNAQWQHLGVVQVRTVLSCGCDSGLNQNINRSLNACDKTDARKQIRCMCLSPAVELYHFLICHFSYLRVNLYQIGRIKQNYEVLNVVEEGQYCFLRVVQLMLVKIWACAGAKLPEINKYSLLQYASFHL